MSKAGGCFITLIVGFVVLSLFIYVTYTPSATRATIGPSDFDACVMAQVFVERGLKSPATAEFPACNSPSTIVTRAADTWSVRSYVDAQNGFGALVRADTVMQMTYHPATRKWTLLNSSIIER
jgi:hypothetical protein